MHVNSCIGQMLIGSVSLDIVLIGERERVFNDVFSKSGVHQIN